MLMQQSCHTWHCPGSTTPALTWIRNGAPGTASSVVEPTHNFTAPAYALGHTGLVSLFATIKSQICLYFMTTGLEIISI